MLVDALNSTYTHPEDCIVMPDAVENGTALAFKEELRRALQTTGVSQKELARYTKRSPAAVSQWLHGKDVPAVDVVMVIEKHLGLAKGTLVYLVEAKRHWGWEDDAPTGEEAFNTALLRHPKLTDDQKAMLRDVTERFIKINDLMVGLDTELAAEEPPEE
jgi:transcriptional regulator with XRE-family HTH domain